MAEFMPEKPVLSVEGDVKMLKTIELKSDGMCVTYSGDGSKIAVGLTNGDIQIFKSDTMSCIYHLADRETQSAKLPVTSINFLPKRNSQSPMKGEILVATYASGQVKFWHVSSSKAMHTIHEPRQVLSCSISKDAKSMVTVGSSNEMRIYDIGTAKQVKVCEPSPNVLVMDGHQGRVFSVKHHPKQDYFFISGGWDNTVQFWDERVERSTGHIFGPHICGEGLDIDATFNHILSASWRKEDPLQVWDFASRRLLKTIPPDYDNNSLLYTGRWLGKNYIVCGGCDNNMLRIIDKTTLATSGHVTGLPGGVYSIDYDPNRKVHHSVSDKPITTLAVVYCKNLQMISHVPKN